LGILVQLSFKLYIHTETYSWVSWCSSLSSHTYTWEPTLGYPGAALFQAIHRHRNLLLGTLVQFSFKLYIHTQDPTLGYPGAALFQAIHTHRNLFLGILVQLSFKLYLHLRTYSRVSWCSSLSSYTYTQEPALGYLGAALFQAIHTHRNLLLVSWCSSLSSYTYTQEPSLGYPGSALFQAIHTHRNLLLGILVQLSFKLYIHTGTYSWVSWCSSLSSYTYTQEPTVGYPGAALFQALNSHRNLLSGILVQLSFKLYIHTGTYSWVSWCSSLSSYTYTQEPTLRYPGAALFQAIHTHRNLLLGILVQLSFKL